MTSLTWYLLIVCCVVGNWGQDNSERNLPPTSPCPAIYGYGWEPAGGWHGLVSILPPARFSEAQLVFRMTVPYYRPEAGVGRVEIKGGTVEVQAISRRAMQGERHQIQFKVIFPPFDEVPRVKEIFINGKSFCSDTRVHPDARYTIELKYVLKTGLRMPVAAGSEFSVVNNNRPSKPDLVIVAILVPLDEARPTVSNPQAPYQPIGDGLQPPSHPIGSDIQPPRPIETGTQSVRPIGSDIQPPRPIETGAQSVRPIGFDIQPPRPIETGAQSHRPIGTGAQSSRPIGSHAQSPSRPIGLGDFSKPSCKCNNKTSSQSSHNNALNLPSSGTQVQNENIGNSGDLFPSRTPSVTHPGGSGGHGNTVVTSPGFQRPDDSSGSGNYFVPVSGGSNLKQPAVDDKIYFIATESDEVNSPRVVKLLEHLLVVAKKRYQLDLERLEIEKKRLALEKNQHYTIVV